MRITLVVAIGCSMLAALCKLSKSESGQDAGAAQAAAPPYYYGQGYVLVPASQPRYARQYVPVNTYGQTVPYYARP